MDSLQRHLRAAQGYSELGMHREAIAELDAIESHRAGGLDVLEARLFVYLRAKRWRDGLRVSRQLCEIAPDVAAGYVHAAFCLHELGETAAAKALLLSGPAALNGEPAYHYNLACYESVLGNIEAAEAHLDASILMNSKFREYAQTDPDLAALRAAKSK